MGYFRELPDLLYQSFLDHRNSSDEYVLTKNLFRRIKLRDDLQNVFTLFDKYQIRDNARPDTVAEEFYGSADLDWVVLMTANITRVRDQWPLSSRNIYQYAEEKYGDSLNDIHHYETIEVKDSEDRLILPSGKVVDSNFTIPNPKDPTSTLNPVIGISNYEYEVKVNEDKRSIYLLKRGYLQQFLNDMRQIMSYTPSSQYLTNSLAKTENTKTTIV